MRFDLLFGMGLEQFSISSLSEEMGRAEFRDRRLSARLSSFISAVASKPSEGFPHLLQSASDLEGWYRLLSNPKVSMEGVFRPHFLATRARVIEQKSCLVIHDTSVFCFDGEVRREGLCRITKNKQGLLGHFALASTMDEQPVPLGLLSCHTFIRKDKGSKEPAPSRGRRHWFETAIAVGKFVGPQANLIHVMDREADSAQIISQLVLANQSFVIRTHFNRQVATEADEINRFDDAIKNVPALCQREVFVSLRKEQHFPNRREMYPARQGRKATLEIRAAFISAHLGESIVPLTLVQAKEINCPDGAPVEWLLITDQQVNDANQASHIVDIYKRRWLIEEFFKALKTGCAFEKRQLESRKTIEVALAALSPVAWRLLLLRAISRTYPEEKAEFVLTSEQLAVLHAHPKISLPKNPTAKDALMAVAALGGHITNNGPPGWIVLGRGFDKLLWLQAGWKMAMETLSQTYDQS